MSTSTTIWPDAAPIMDASRASSGRGNAGATVIEARRPWRLLDWKELQRYHELLFFLVWRDVKVQYKQMVLGPLWAVLRPLVNLVIFSVIFGSVIGVPGEGPYPVMVQAGLLPWMFFAGAVTAASNSLVTQSHLISKVYFPRVLLPMSSIGSGLVTLGINFVIYAGLMVYYGTAPGWSVLLLPLLVVLTAALALGTGLLFAGLTVIYRDVRFMVASLVQVWMYLSPVIYEVKIIPEGWRWLLILNPMTGVIDAFRAALLDRPLEWMSLSVAVVMTVVLLVTGLLVFHHTEQRFADVA